jgi:hypothetical protein
MDMSDTPETDDQPTINAINDNGYQVPCVDIDFARKLERERDEANELLASEKITRNHIIKRSVEVERELDEVNEELHKQMVRYDQLFDEAEKIRIERDEAREALSDWENAALHVEADHPDEKHCGCVPILRKLLTEAREKYDNLATEHMLVVNKLCKERDDAREQIKELIYIAGRAIDLAEIDFENDKFGVVSELRSDLEKIKKSK